MNFSTQAILFSTSGLICLELLIFAALLIKRKLFHWAGAGFWAWAAFLLYFVINPFFVALTGTNLERYDIRLSLSGGAGRALWILAVLVIGIAVYFTTYLKITEPSDSNWRLKYETIPFPGKLFLLSVLGFGIYSLITYRTFRSVQDVLIESGRFVGDVTGYENSGYKFLFFPISYLLLSKQKSANFLGWILGIAFLALSVPHGWGRYTIISLVILFSVASVLKQELRWPSFLWILLLVSFGAILQVRGHTSWSYQVVDELALGAASTSVQNFDDVLAAGDTSMLATFYLESFLHDEFIGYNYGLPVINYLLTGWIPSRIFPEKYFLVDWLREQQGAYPPIIARLLFGAKSSMIGDLYANGWLLGVVLGASFLGYLSRKLDGWRSPESHPIVRASAIAFLSQLWMIWGSGLAWGLIRLGIVIMPAIVLWLLMQIDPLKKKRYGGSPSLETRFTVR